MKEESINKNTKQETEKQAQANLKAFEEWYAKFLQACEAIGIDEKQGHVFIDVLSGSHKGVDNHG